MSLRFREIIGIGVITSGLFFVVDRICKYYFLQNPDQRWDFVFFTSFHFAKNYGIAFSFHFYMPILIALTILALLYVLHVSFRAYVHKNYVNIIGSIGIIFGSFSNLYDRIAYGFVIDYFDISFFSIMNIADILITVGVLSIVINELIIHKHQ